MSQNAHLNATIFIQRNRRPSPLAKKSKGSKILIMIYAYIRVSTDRQTVANQMFEVQAFARLRGFAIDKWVEETASGVKRVEERRLGKLLRKLREGDTLIVSEISRLGRNLMQIMGILNLCMERRVRILAIKEGYELGDNLNSKVLAFAFGLCAELERTLISQRTKEALARKRAEGVVLGRPKGAYSARTKLTGKESAIRDMMARRICNGTIIHSLRVSRSTFYRFVKEKQLCP